MGRNSNLDHKLIKAQIDQIEHAKQDVDRRFELDRLDKDRNYRLKLTTFYWASLAAMLTATYQLALNFDKLKALFIKTTGD